MTPSPPQPSHIPLPTSPLKGEELGSLPFKGRAGVGMGFVEDGVIRIKEQPMEAQTNSFILKNRLQRVLRRNMTDAEQALWKRLRGHQIKGYKFRRQHPFGDYILDFVCLEAKLVIEADGGQHNESTQDLVRDQALASAGFRVMRFWNNQVLNEIESVVESIWLELERLPPSPPQPSP